MPIKTRTCLALALVGALLIWSGCQGTKSGAQFPVPGASSYSVTGEVREVRAATGTLVIRHEEVPGFMPAMTMPFSMATTNDLAGLAPGDQLRFRLTVSNEQSWIDRIVRVTSADGSKTPAPESAAEMPAGFNIHKMPDFAFTNEFGQPVSLQTLDGTAFAFTFFFTRCPVPEYCPRLAKNFAAASEKLKSQPAAPTNWRLFSISFDPHDTPAVLRDYAARYHYDSNRWTFLTAPPEQIREMARGFGLKISDENGVFNHSFMTAVFDPTGRLQRRWPLGGDTSEALVTELIRAARLRSPDAKKGGQ